MSALPTTRVSMSATRSTSRPGNRRGPSSSPGSRGSEADSPGEPPSSPLRARWHRSFSREGQYDSISVSATGSTSEAELVAAIQGSPGRSEGREGHGRSRGTGGRGERVHGDLQLLHPGVRRDRPLGRRLRDLQHVLDHRGTAHAGVRDASDDRSDSTADPRLRDPRGARHRPHRALVGRGLGVALAEGIEGLFGAHGVELPAADRVFALRTLIWPSPSASGSRSSPAYSRQSGRRACRRSRSARVRPSRSPRVRTVRALGRRRCRRGRPRRGRRHVHRRARDRRSIALDRGRCPSALPRRRDACLAPGASACDCQQSDRSSGFVERSFGQWSAGKA